MVRACLMPDTKSRTADTTPINNPRTVKTQVTPSADALYSQMLAIVNGITLSANTVVASIIKPRPIPPPIPLVEKYGLSMHATPVTYASYLYVTGIRLECVVQSFPERVRDAGGEHDRFPLSFTVKHLPCGDNDPALASYEDALAYCTAVGMRLPTKKEWLALVGDGFFDAYPDDPHTIRSRSDGSSQFIDDCLEEHFKRGCADSFRCVRGERSLIFGMKTFLQKSR